MKPNPNWSMWAGGLGAGLAVLCCIIPIAVIGLGAAGAGVAVAWRDVVLFPALFLFAAVFVGALIWGRRRNATRLSSNSTPKRSENP